MAPLALTFLLVAGPLVTTSAGTPDATRAIALGADREAAVGVLERISLAGGPESVATIADALVRWTGDKEMEGRGLSALKRVEVAPKDLARLVVSDADAAHRGWAAWTCGAQRI